MKKKNKEELVKKISSGLDHSKFISGLYDRLNVEFGDYVISGLSTTMIQTIGYVVQIRKKWGAFKSDMFFIRDIDGNLATHENQCFWKLTEEQIELVKPFFEITPDEEIEDNPKLEYTIKEDQKEDGFIVRKEYAPDRTDTCAFAITVSKTEQ